MIIFTNLPISSMFVERYHVLWDPTTNNENLLQNPFVAQYANETNYNISEGVL